VEAVVVEVQEAVVQEIAVAHNSCIHKLVYA
jgi:hypothetical protein